MSIEHDFFHIPTGVPVAGLVLTHGAGGNCRSALLVAVADAFCAAGALVMRTDLPFRRLGRSGPPVPARQGEDRAGLREAVGQLRARVSSVPVFLGGHSYGGRQASMLAAEEPEVAEGLLLLSYPLHPPGKPAQLRTAHFPALKTPTTFVHGTRDQFGTPEEMQAAIALISAGVQLITVPGAGHDLKKGAFPMDEIVRSVLGKK